MKKIYLSAFLALTASFALAQSMPQLQAVATNVKANPLTESAAAIDATDTLGLDMIGSQLATYIDLGGSGYFTGTLSTVDSTSLPGVDITIFTSELAAGFLSDGEYNVIGAMFFGDKVDVSGGGADDLRVNLYYTEEEAAASTFTAQSPDVDGPGTLLESVSLPFADVQASTETAYLRTYAFFDEPVWTNGGDICIGIDFEDVYATNDTIVIASDVVDETSDGTQTWMRQGNDFLPQRPWIRLAAIGGTSPFNVTLAIFAIVAESETSIEEQGFLNGVKMTTYPNPAVSADAITVQFGLETAAEKVSINIYDMNGRVVHSIVEGDKMSGLHNVVIPAGTLSAGSYIYSIEANGGRMAKKLEVLK